jgi:hypothetical protein
VEELQGKGYRVRVGKSYRVRVRVEELQGKA